MRKFLVHYRHWAYEFEYYTCEIELNKSEKANTETFENKLNSFGCGGKEVLSWSLIEE